MYKYAEPGLGLLGHVQFEIVRCTSTRGRAKDVQKPRLPLHFPHIYQSLAQTFITIPQLQIYSSAGRFQVLFH